MHNCVPTLSISIIIIGHAFVMKSGSNSSEFLVGFPRNGGSDGVLAESIELTLFVTTTEEDPVPFVVETLLGFMYTGTATNDSTTTVELSNSYQVHDSNDTDKGIRIYAGNKQISVFGLNYHYLTSGAFFALPCSTQRLNEYVYYGLTYYDKTTGLKSQLLFVGCEDNTTITIGSRTIFLNKMETYLFTSISDVTGTVIISNNPVSFFSGHECTYIPANIRSCDHLIQQIPDTSTWGTHFFSASFAGRYSGDIYRVLASQPSTTVTFTCSTLSQPSTYTLPSAGSWREITTSKSSFCSIVSNNPVLVVQFAQGRRADNTDSDPFMTVIPAIDQYSNNYVIPFSSHFPANFITIFVTAEHYHPEDIYVDDVSLGNLNWTAISCPSNTTCGYSAYAILAPGDHRIYHTNKAGTIGVIAYGFNDGVSYGFPAGVHKTAVQGTL